MKLKSIPRRLGYILGAQWTRDLSWTLFTILLSRNDPFLLGQIMLALGYGYLVKTAADVGLNDFLLSSFSRRDARPTVLLGEVLWLKCALLFVALGVTWIIVSAKANYSPELRLIVLCIAAGFGIDGISDTFFALCQARGRQDVEMRIRIPAAVFGIGFGMFDANNMPILCQIISAKYRATAYGIMNMVGVFAGAAVTHLLGKWTDGGNLGMGFAVLGGIVIVALVLQLACLRPTSDNVE